MKKKKITKTLPLKKDKVKPIALKAILHQSLYNKNKIYKYLSVQVNIN